MAHLKCLIAHETREKAVVKIPDPDGERRAVVAARGSGGGGGGAQAGAPLRLCSSPSEELLHLVVVSAIHA